MSLPYLINSAKGYVSASQRIPAIAQPFVSERAKTTLDLVEKFVEEDCIPADTVFAQQLKANGTDTKSRFSTHPAVLGDLKRKAKSLGLWNLFLPKAHFKEGAGFSNLEYGLMAELLGKSDIAPEACNCNAPDTGNMEVLAKYGTEAQKKKWLVPLLDGAIRSAFLMTEPQVASSDATNIELTMRKDGSNYILNGQPSQLKWSSGAGDENCKVYIVMGKTDPSNPDKYKQQSLILVPAGTPGVTVTRVLSVMGFDHAPHGHGHITFNNVRVPAENIILRPGGGFEAERGLEYLLARLNDPTKTPFGQPLHSHGIQLERVARSRIEIDTARLSVLNAAITIDQLGAKGAMKEIAEVKVQVPSMLLEILDRAMQAYGGAGVSQDTPLAAMWANGRTMRIVDGPDEVHVLQLGKNENKRGNALRERIDKQKARATEMLASYGLHDVDSLSLDRAYGQPKL
ncbi:hypothetical protein IFR05_005418 [Cadophora sp. M221]|nr:hypothetical protein IFR05_005418 [Cadophora sp. M221]